MAGKEVKETKGTEDLVALQEISKVLAGTVGLKETLSLILESIEKKLGYLFVTILLVNKEKNCLDNYMFGPSLPTEKIAKMVGLDLSKVSVALSDKENLMVRTVLTGKSQYTLDIYDYAKPVVKKFIVVPVQKMLGIKLIGTAPLISKKEVVGVLSFGKKMDEPLTDEKIKTLSSFANHAGLAIERAKAVAELKETGEKLKEYSERLEERTKELEKAQEKLIRKEKLAAIGLLAGGVGHELRNPLGVISNSAYYLNRKLKDADEKVKKHLDILKREVRGANKIITDLLDFSRTREPSLAKGDVNSVVKDALAKIKLPENIALEWQLNENLPRIQLDPDQIGRVCQNIISNAIQAMAEGGKLKIKTQARADFIEIIFQDTGQGILRENLSKIFEPLFTNRARGIGLGLAIVKSLIEGHKGKIEVESEVGKGTRFTVKLPF